MMFGSVTEHFTNPRHVKDEKLVFRARMQYFEVPNLWTIHSSPLDPKMMFRSVSEHFANLRHVKDAKLVFGPEFTISGYQSCETFILVHWTQNGVYECFRWFHEASAHTTFKTIVRAWMHYFVVPKLWSIHFSPLDPKMMFGSVLEHFANLRHVKDAKLVFRAWMHNLGVPKLWSIHSSPLNRKWCLWVF
jgi:uncharacterized protein YodC (DUF2158 family)